MGNQASNHLKIVLASASPRREDFIRAMRFPYRVEVKAVDESYPADLKRHQITDHIALAKAKAFEGSLANNEILLTSDTLVWVDDLVLGKPKDAQEATAMLKQLSGKKHHVITSVCLKSNEKMRILHEETAVYFAALRPEDIAFYIKEFSPFDKAGSYGIQEWIGTIGIEKIEGSYTNVVGLPTAKVYEALQNWEL